MSSTPRAANHTGIESLIVNTVDFHPGRPFGAILGLAPSKGARSPTLWRAAFSALGMDADFHPFDVTPEKLEAIVEALGHASDFIGGAVAVPYKERIVPLLDRVEHEAQAIGAVNAIYRDNTGALVGANTDGAAALQVLEAQTGRTSGKSVLQLGIGGAGRAVAVYLSKAGAELMIWNRTEDRARRFVTELAEHSVRLCTDPVALLGEIDILVNCTSAGYEPDGRPTADTPIATTALAGMKPGTVVFDIIYQPPRTPILEAAARHGQVAINGLEMNTLQAVIAFMKAVPEADGSMVAAAIQSISK